MRSRADGSAVKVKETIMTRRFAGALLSLVLACAWSVSAAQSEGPRAAEEKTIRSLEEQERMAVLKEDVPALERLWAEQLIVNNPQNEISADRGVVLDRVRRGLIRYSQFERRIEAIRFDEDLAIVMGSETVVRKGETASATQAVRRRFTNIWKKSGPGWRMIARQANVVPGS
jgi:ketosteroid isomerase-like protein